MRKFPELTMAENLDTEIPKIYRYVEDEAEHAIDWYMESLAWKKWWSRFIRYSAIVLGGIAGLLPIIASIWPVNWSRFGLSRQGVSLMTSLFIGIVAILFALDSLGDFSRGWIRYVLSAFDIRRALQEFRMNWASEWAKLPHPLTVDNAAVLILLAKEFVLKVEQAIGEETRQWATEFAQNLAQMEKEMASKWEEQKKKIESEREAAKPGAIQLTVTNAKATNNRQFEVELQTGDSSTESKSTVVGAQTWGRSSVTPGMYTITVKATLNEKSVAAHKVIQVKPDAICDVTLTLMD
ncbi:MAG TPA: SLATT domain-containing protein [Blastocatellia bacterium]|nr:SLATT domain-containing protein [Blastocatellia bacterium]